MSEEKKAEQDERGAFEAHIRNECDDAGYADMILRTNAHGFYHVTRIQGAWEGWQARAASTSANVAQGAVAPDGRVVDKAMVKRLAVQYGLLPEQTVDVAQGAEAPCLACVSNWPLHDADCPDAAPPAQTATMDAVVALLSKVPMPPNAITFDKGWELLDELQRIALTAAKSGEPK